MWCMGDSADGNDNDRSVGDGWKSVFDDGDDDMLIVDRVAVGEVPTFDAVVVGSESWLMSFRGPVKV